MSPELIFFGINSLIRLGVAANRAFTESAIDAKAIFPDVLALSADPVTELKRKLRTPTYKPLLQRPDFATLWSDTEDLGQGGFKDPAGIERNPAFLALWVAALRYAELSGGEAGTTSQIAEAQIGLVFVKQWREGKGPVAPWARVAITLADIGLEYVAVNPGIVGASGRLKPVISGFAAHIAQEIPDDGAFGPKERSGERILGVLMRGALQTLQDDKGSIFRDQDVRELVGVVSKELLGAFPANASLTTQLDFDRLIEAALGPAANAAMRKIAARPNVIFGRGVKPSTASGAVVSAIFLTLADGGLKSLATDEGREAIIDAVLRVAATKPELFIKGANKNEPDVGVARDLLKSLATVLADTQLFGASANAADLPAKLAAGALEAIAANAARFAKPGKPWEALAADLVKQLLSVFANGLKDGRLDIVAEVLNREQLDAFGRVFLTHLATVPQMLVGKRHEDLSRVLAAVARAMADDKKLLLSGDDWLEIARVAAEQAAVNPGRLFGIRGADEGGALASALIGVLFRAVAGLTEAKAADERRVLYGKTLRDATIILLDTFGGQPDLAATHMDQIKDIAAKIDMFVADNAGQFGSREWLLIFRRMLRALVEGGPAAVPALDVATARKMVGETQP